MAEAAPTLDQPSLDAYNLEIKNLLRRGYDRFFAEIESAVIDGINENRILDKGDYGKIKISEYRLTKLVGFNNAPGLSVGTDGGLVVEIPSTGSWEIKVKLIVKFQSKLVQFETSAWIGLRNIKIQQKLRISGEDSGKVDISNVERPQVTYEPFVDINTDVGKIRTALGDLVNKKLTKKLQAKLDEAYASLQSVESQSLLPVGGTIHYNATPYDPNLEAVIMHIDDKIQRQNMVNGNASIVYRIYCDADSEGSWQESYQYGAPDSMCWPNGKPGDGGVPTGYNDTAIWTGSYLASLAYRFKVKKDNINQIDKTLRGIEALFAAYANNPNFPNSLGLMARTAAPVNSKIGQSILSRMQTGDYTCTRPECGPHVFTFNYTTRDGVVHNEQWVSNAGGKGSDGITRDQYTGVLFGLRAAFDLVDDANIKARARYLVQIAMDYFIRENWVILDDRHLPESFAIAVNSKIAWLTIAHHVTGKYSQELDESYKQINIAWLSNALSALKPLDSYFGWNLFYTNMLSYFAIEKDPTRRAKMMESVRIADYYIGHHNNAWFNLVRASYTDDENKRKAYFKQALELLKLRLQGGHRHFLPAALTDELRNVQYQTFTFPVENLSIPSLPLHPALRDYGDFVWQRSPYKLASDKVIQGTNGYKRLEQIGGDMTLVYWMLRDNGYPLNIPAIMSIINNLILD